MVWVFLVLAGLCEVIWAVGLKKFGFTLTWGGAMTIVMMLLSFLLLSQAMKDRTMPLGTCYAIWTGIGAGGTAIFGMVWLGEPRDWPRIACLGLVVAGIIGLKVLSTASE